MKIVDLRARCVAIPITAQLRSNSGVHPGYFARTIIELVTDEGIIGLGELSDDRRSAMASLKERLVGLDPFQTSVIKARLQSKRGMYAPVEVACLDIQGKVAGRPLHDLLGGRVRDRVPFIAYLFWRYDRPGGGDDLTAEDVAEHCVELAEQLGVRAMKLKAGVAEPREEARVLELCRRRLGDGFGLRIDPNGVWSVATAVRIARRLEELDIEYLEDPAWGLEGNAAVRRQVRMPIATNMYPARFDDLGPGIRMGAADIILTDLHYWDGPRGVRDLCAVCRTFALGVAMHSGQQFGVEMAAMIHTAATIPEMIHAGDAHYHYLTDDIIAGGLMRYEDGCITVPTGPGLGVELDPEKMEKYERYFDKVGDYMARFKADPRRPDWHPVIGGH